ncbi:MAG: TonB-dependent receptor family protein [Saprospiraceae bacterium]
MKRFCIAIFTTIHCITWLTAQDISKDTIQIEEVTVSALRSQTGVTRFGAVENGQIYAGKKNDIVLLSRAHANLVTNNARQIFAKVPGIMVWENDGSGTQLGVATRGLSPNRSWEFNVRQNGYDITPDIFGYPEAYYTPPMEALDRIEVIRGAASLQYGPQFGGLLNMRIKQAPTDRKFMFETSNTVGSYGLFSTFNAIGGTVGKFNYYGFVNHRFADGWRQNSEYQVTNGFVRLGYKFNDKLEASVEGTYFTYENQQPGGLTDAQLNENPRQSVRARNWFNAPWFVGNATLRYTPSANFEATLRVSHIESERNSVGFVRAITIPDTLNESLGTFNPRQVDRDLYSNWSAELRTLTKYNLFGQQHALAAGARWYTCDTDRLQLGIGTTGNDYDLAVVNDLFPRDLQYTTNNQAFFAENLFQLTDNLSITPGVRVEFIQNDAQGRINIANGNPVNIAPQEGNRTVVLAGVGAEWKAFSTAAFYANFTQAFRPVLFSDLTPGATTDVIDENLQDSKGYNLDFGFRGAVDGWMTFDVSVFQLFYDNRVGTLAQIGADNRPFNLRTNVGASLSRGVEAYAEIDVIRLLAKGNRLRQTALSVFGSLSFLNAEYDDFQVISYNSQTQSLSETNLDGKKVEYAPDYIHRIGATFTHKNVSLSYQHSFTGEVFADAANTVAPSANGQVGLIPAYDIADLNLRLSFLKNYAIRAGVNNLYDATYATRRAGGYPGPGLMPGDGRTWYVSVGAKF